MKRISVAIVFLLAAAPGSAQQKLLIAAASDLRFALDSLISVFHHHAENAKVVVSYGSSGKLTEQILQGAPFDILLAADIAFPKILEKNKKSGSAIYAYGKGHLVVWTLKSDLIEGDMNALANPAVARVAIANPQHAPYGQRAIEALTYYGLLERVNPKLVYGENVSQTAQFVSSGAADIGIVALSFVRSTALANTGSYFVIPEKSHKPLIQGAVITQSGKNNPLAYAFFHFLGEERAISILEHFGFEKP